MKLKDFENVVFAQDTKVVVSWKFNEGVEWEAIKEYKKATNEEWWGWNYEVSWIGKSKNYDIVIHIRP